MHQKMMDAAAKLRRADLSGVRGLVGFDGFVDEVVHVVDKRYDAEHFRRIETIRAYGERICAAAGLSTNIEVVPLQRKIGGNGTIFANSLLRHGVQLNYIGALGRPAIHPIFEDFVRDCASAYSISEPGYTDAVEFLDGKIIRSKLDGLKAVSWESLMEVVGREQLLRLVEDASFLAFMNWSLVVNVTDIWDGILREILPKLTQGAQRRKLFIDLADPEKRSAEDLLHALHTIEGMNEHLSVILGVNKKEACEILALFGVSIPDYAQASEDALLDLLLEQLRVDTIVVHSRAAAAGGNAAGCRAVAPVRYCETPRLTTGAGDNFNAGFMLGQICGLSLEESLITAVSNSGYYVRNGQSPDLRSLTQYMEESAQLQP